MSALLSQCPGNLPQEPEARQEVRLQGLHLSYHPDHLGSILSPEGCDTAQEVICTSHKILTLLKSYYKEQPLSLMLNPIPQTKEQRKICYPKS